MGLDSDWDVRFLRNGFVRAMGDEGSGVESVMVADEDKSRRG